MPSHAIDENGRPRISGEQSVREERRKESRYKPLEGRAFLGWWDDASYRTTAVRVRNLSPNGAALLMEEKPRATDLVWLCPISLIRPDWYPADVLGVEGDPVSGWILRVAFSRTFAFDVFKSLIFDYPIDEPLPTKLHLNGKDNLPS